MKDDALLEALEETAEKLAITLDYDDVRKGVITSYGGAYTLRGQKHVVIHKKQTTREKIELLSEILSRFDTEEVHLAPEIRDRLARAREEADEREAKAAKKETSTAAAENTEEPATEEV
ncbi:MAG: hypothetical protein V3T30_07055 [Thermodesulfobacteriota bacterium]